jgi:hypothetical protein
VDNWKNITNRELDNDSLVFIVFGKRRGVQRKTGSKLKKITARLIKVSIFE